MVPFGTRQLISVRLFALSHVPIPETLLGFCRATIWSGTIPDEPKKMETMPQPKAHRQSSRLQTTPFNLDRSLTAKNVDPSVCRTGIVCELGPSSRDTPTLTNMIANGMTIAKIVCSKDLHDYVNQYDSTIINNLRTAVADYSIRLGVNLPIAVALEIMGGNLFRTGKLKDGLKEVKLKAGAPVKIVVKKSFEENCSSEVIWISYPQLGRELQKDSLINIDYGKIVLKVVKSDAESINCIVWQGGVLGSKKTVFIPGVDEPSTIDNFHKDLQWGMQCKIDMVFASLTETAEGIQAVRKALGKEGKHIKVFAKIENFEGLKNFNEILEAADGIVLARDSLSKCILPENMFSVQKAMVTQCNKEGKPVIVAGDVLRSMMSEPQPSRSDCSDITTLVLDGADCVELAAETAEGRYPEETVACLSTICRACEAAILHDQIFHERSGEVEGQVEANHAFAIAAVKAAITSRAKSIVCVTRSGETACLLAKYSPPCPVITVTRHPQVAKECLLYRALLPIIYEAKTESDGMLDVEGSVRYAIKYGMALNILQRKDTFIVLSEGKETYSVRLAVETVDQYSDSVNIETQYVDGTAGVIGKE